MGGGGGKTQTVTNKTELPAWLEGVTKENLAIADEISKRPYQAYGGQTVAGFSPEQERAFSEILSGYGSEMGQYGQASDITRGVAGYTPTSFLNANIQGYMNPYVENVETRAIDNANRALRANMSRIGDQAAAARAFGGSRQGIAEGVAAAEGSRGIGDLSAQLRSQAFNEAAQQFGADQARAAQAQQLRLSAGSQLANLAQQRQQARYMDYAGLEGIGAQRQAMQQAQLDDAYNRYLEQRNYPIEMLNLRLGATSATPYGSTQTQTRTGGGGNALMTGLGAAGTVASIGASLATIF
jgi:hypothetical protein